MAIRTNEDAVKETLLGDYDTKKNYSLMPFIETASVIVDQMAEVATESETPYSDSMLEILERWLAAHFYVQGDPSYTARSTLGASGSYTGQFAMGLDNSRYGQQFRFLDYRRTIDEVTASEADTPIAEGYWGGGADT